MRLGIDFGTTNSAAVVFDGHQLHPISIFTPEQTDLLPSMIYIDRQHNPRLGLEATREYTQRETGRPVRWRSRLMGQIETWFAGTGSSPILVQQDIIVTYDDAANGRLLQAVKTALRNHYYHGTQIFNRFYTADELVMLLLKRLKDGAEAQLGKSCDEVVIGRPVKFSDKGWVDARAEEIIYKAARLAGFRDITFQAEPVGALYVYHMAATTRQTVLVFDFGGGTLDLTIAEVGAGIAPHILATRGVLVGGDDLDRRMMQSLFKYFGDDPKNELRLPPEFQDLLSNWQTMPELSRPQHADTLRRLRHESKHPETIDALQTLVSKNLGFSLFSAIEHTKRQLTDAPAAALQFQFENININERFSRPQFERIIRDEVRQVRTGIEQTLADAGLRPDQLDVVLRTGGTSLVPAFVNLLGEVFSAAKIHAMDPLLSVVGGLGIIAHEDKGLYGPYRSRYVNTTDEAVKEVSAYSKAKTVYKTGFMRVGARCYTDQETVVSKIPVELSQLPVIVTAYADRENTADDFLHFVLPCPARIYVAYQASALNLPRWLEPFMRLDDLRLEIESEWWGVKELHLYSHLFPAGAVVLGGNTADGFSGRAETMYLVVIERQSDES